MVIMSGAVGESGQETNGALFRVSVVMTDQEYEQMLIKIEERKQLRARRR
jgi:hypothetical protein